MRDRAKHFWFSLLFIFVVSFAVAEQTTVAAGFDFGDVGVDILDTELLSVYPSELDFGEVIVEDTSYDQVLLSASEEIVITSLSIIGSSAYSIVATPVMPPYTIGPSSGMPVQIAFEPTAIAEYNAILEITYGIGNLKQVVLHGFGVDPTPMLDLYGYYYFGEVGEAGASTDFEVSLSPDWMSDHLTGEVISVSVVGDPCFAIGTITNITTSSAVTIPFELGYTDILNIPITCTPTYSTPEDELNAELRVFCEDGRTYIIYLSAIGRMFDPSIEVSPPYVMINAVEGSIGTGVFYVKNTGGGVLDFTIEDDDMPSWLSFSRMTGNVNSGDSLLVTVQADATDLLPGSHSFTCEISNNDPWSYYTTIGTIVHVSSLPLVADFHADILTGHPPFEVNFTDDSRSDPAQTWSTINSWKWDFNNDGVFDSFVQNPSYEYTAPGVYSVRLVIGTNTGAVSSKLRTNYISMLNSSPHAIDSLHTITMDEDTQWGPNYILGLFEDPDGDPLTLSCAGSEHLAATVAYGYLTLTPAPDWYGIETITIIASDPFGESVQHNVVVTVEAVNDAPVLSIPNDLYFIRNSVFTVDFAPYIDDPDNPDEELSLQISHLHPIGDVVFAYTPINAPNTVGQLTVAFSSPSQIATSAHFSISVNDNMGRLIATTTFTMHVLEHFSPDITIGDSYEYAGQTVVFNDVTLGNPDHWFWEFGDGSSSELQNPQHQYLLSGTYDIRLTLGNSQVPEEDRMVFIPGMITLSGTAVTVTDIPDTWTVLGSPYNLFGDVVIDSTATVTVEDNVVVNLFSEAPLQVRGAILANGVRFQSQSGSGKWGGIKFRGSGLREPSSLTNCQIIDALLPVDIATQSPVLSNLYIAVSDTTEMADGEAIRIYESSCQISGAEILNYKGGITVDGQGQDRATPTLINIRVRNASNTQRTEDQGTVGVTLKSFATVEDLEVDNCSTGIVIGSDNATYSSTPTLINIRVRNSSNTQRAVVEGTGILITGNAAPTLTDVDISEVANGIVIDDISSLRATPTLINIRVRNSSNTTRSLTNGLIIRNTPNVLISDAWFDDFTNGISIDADSRAVSTPSLINIRVRNASNTQRTTATGIKITGSVNASLNDVEIEDYHNGLSYIMTNSTRATATVTLGNIRVRNASNTQRQLSTGALFSGLEDLRITDMEIENFSMGLKITAPDTRAAATPTLINIRVRNASNTQREESTGIFLGQGVLGSMKDSVVEEAAIGIMIAEGNKTVLANNQIINCKTGLRATGTNPLPLRKQLFVVEDAYLAEHPAVDFCAFELNGAGPWSISQNTISGYKKGVKATNADLNFHSNILWSTGQELTPFINVNNSSVIQNSFNDIYLLSGLYPGIGNINLNPMFMQPAERDFSLNRSSPCIDAGNPALPADADGSIADMGYLCFLHSASAIPSARFVVTGTQVDFTNNSLGHDYPDTQIQWDIDADNIIDGTGRNFSYTFDSPGVYNLRLTMQSGDLIDQKFYYGMIAVSSSLLFAPQNPALTKSGDDIVFTWDAVTETVEGIPLDVPYYLVYKSDSPDGFYHYAGLTSSPQTSYTDRSATLLDSKAFYLVLGFTGTRAEMLRFIETTPRISRQGVRQ